VSAQVLSRDWGDAVAVAADVMLNAAFPADQVEIERRKILSAIDNLESNHSSLASRAWSRAIYGADHPLGQTTATSKDILAGVTRDELLAHHRKFVRPNNTTIVCVGRFDQEAVAARVRELLGAWEPSKDANFRRSARVEASMRKGTQFFTNKDFDESKMEPQTATIAIDHADKAQCIVRVGRLGITRDHPDYFACLVLDNILGTSPAFSDRFSRILRDEMGLAYSVYANIANSSTEEPGALIGYIATRPESVGQSLEGMRAIMRGIQAEQVTDVEFARAKNYLISSTLLGLEGSGAMAGLIQDIERYDLGYDWLKRYAAGIQAVTKDHVLECAKKHLGPEGLITVVAGPLDRIPEGREFLAGWNISDDPPAVEPTGNGAGASGN
jgi:zinc protease